MHFVTCYEKSLALAKSLQPQSFLVKIVIKAVSVKNILGENVILHALSNFISIGCTRKMHILVLLLEMLMLHSSRQCFSLSIDLQGGLI